MEEEWDIKKLNFIPEVTASVISTNHLQNLPHKNPFFPRCKKGADQMILTLPEATACSSHVIMRLDKSFVSTRQAKALIREDAQGCILLLNQSLPLQPSLWLSSVSQGGTETRWSIPKGQPHLWALLNYLSRGAESSNFWVQPFREIMTTA